MKRILYFVFILLLILPAYLFCKDDPEAFPTGNEQTVPDNSVNVNDILAPEDNAPAAQPGAQGQGGDNYLNAMSDSSKTGIEQEQKGVTAKQVVASPTPIAKNEAMFQSNEINIEQKSKTRQEIDKDVQDLYKEGKKYYDIEDYDGAAAIWYRIILNYPTAKNLYNIRYSLANAYEYSRAYQQAIEQYQKVLAENPKSDAGIESGYRLAGCYSKLGKYPYAIEIYKDMIGRDPSKAEVIRAYFSLGAIYMKQEKFKRVEIIYRNIIKYFPNTASEIQGRFQLAQLYSQTNRYKSSVKEYKLIKYKYKNTEWAPLAAIHIGDTYKLAGDYKNAKEAYNQVIYEFYKYEAYTRQAEERINSLKYAREIAEKTNSNYSDIR
jgi:tetratricopeptide (TPR) repeat protein